MKCKYIKKDNEQCEANPINNSEYCFMHDPTKEEERTIAVTKGGMTPKKFLLNNNEEIVMDTVADAKRFLNKVINGVWQGSIPATPVASTLGFLVRCFLDAQEKSEIETKVDEIEKIVIKIVDEQRK